MAGSIEKNSYRLTVAEGFDLNGKPIIYRETVHGINRDAEVELAKFVTEIKNWLVVNGKSFRFSEFTEIWKRDELASSTYKVYCRILETRLLPYFGHFTLIQLNQLTLWNFMIYLKKILN